MTADSTALVPPRPNPGPEPFDEPGLSWGWVAGVPVAVGLLALWVWNRRRRRARRALELGPEPVSPGSLQEPIVALAESVRAALVARFGTSWRAKTTEEIASEACLVAAFGIETAERLVTLLRKADRAKFAPAGSADSEPQCDNAGAWALWVAEFGAAAGTSSTINGK